MLIVVQCLLFGAWCCFGGGCLMCVVLCLNFRLIALVALACVFSLNFLYVVNCVMIVVCRLLVVVCLSVVVWVVLFVAWCLLVDACGF